jgi:hypothetical protein
LVFFVISTPLLRLFSVRVDHINEQVIVLLRNVVVLAVQGLCRNVKRPFARTEVRSARADKLKHSRAPLELHALLCLHPHCLLEHQLRHVGNIIASFSTHPSPQRKPPDAQELLVTALRPWGGLLVPGNGRVNKCLKHGPVGSGVGEGVADGDGEWRRGERLEGEHGDLEERRAGGG